MIEAKTIKIRVYVATDKVGSKCTDEFEVDADASDEEIEEQARDVMWNMAEWGWERA